MRSFRPDIKDVTVTDICGRSRNVPVDRKGARIVLKLGPSPIYVEGLRPEDVMPLL